MKAAGIVVALLPVLAADDFFASGSRVRRKPDCLELVRLAGSVYAKHCAACRGVCLEGRPNLREPDTSAHCPRAPHDASGHTWHHPDALPFRITNFCVAKAANCRAIAWSLHGLSASHGRARRPHRDQ